MCKLCDEAAKHGMTFQACGQCSISICFDVQGHGDSVLAPASFYNGDLLCLRCAGELERRERRLARRDALPEFDPHEGCSPLKEE